MIPRRLSIAVTLLAVTAAAGCSSSGKGGSPSGSATSSKPIARFSTLTGKTTAVTLAPAFIAALTKLKLTPSVYGNAKINASGGSPSVELPITGGNLTVYKKGTVSPQVQGEIDHRGSGFSLSAGSVSVTLRNFVIHLGKTSTMSGDVVVNGKPAGPNITLFDLDLATLQTPTVSPGGVVTLQGGTLKLSNEAAIALKTVAASAGGVTAGATIGTETITATGTS